MSKCEDCIRLIEESIAHYTAEMIRSDEAGNYETAAYYEGLVERIGDIKKQWMKKQEGVQ